MFARVEDAYELANALLGELPRLRDQMRLHRVTAKLAMVRADSDLFRGRLDAGERWYRLAAERAVEVGDTGLALWALALLAMGRTWTGAAPRQILTIAAEAHHLGAGQHGAATAMLAAAEARARARLGDRAALMETMRLAEAELGRLRPASGSPAPSASPTRCGCWRRRRPGSRPARPWRPSVRRGRRSPCTRRGTRPACSRCGSTWRRRWPTRKGRTRPAPVAREALPGPAVHPDDRSGWVVHGIVEVDRHLERYQGMRAVQEFRELVISTGLRR